jgi:hypothetical protein
LSVTEQLRAARVSPAIQNGRIGNGLHRVERAMIARQESDQHDVGLRLSDL